MGGDGFAIKMAFDVIRQRTRRGISKFRLGGHCLQCDVVEIPAQPTPQRTRGSRLGLSGTGIVHLRGGCARIARFVAPPGDQFRQHDAQRVDVGGGRDLSAFELFGRGIGRGHWAVLRGFAVFAVEQLGDAEIQKLHLAARGDHDIRWFEIAMNYQCAMCSLDSAANGDEQLQPFGNIKCLLARIFDD